MDSQVAAVVLPTDEMRFELLVSCCLPQLAFMNLRVQTEGAVTSSDASMLGGGVAFPVDRFRKERRR